MAPPTDRRPIVISGPSGVGKGTLCQYLLSSHPDTFTLSVSHTTRSPRPGEIAGQSYNFISASEFSAMIQRGDFVEHTNFNGHHYGTSRQTISEQEGKGLLVILEVDAEGVRQIKNAPDLDARYVFIKPPSLEILEGRLRGRGTNSEESIRKRLQTARSELEFAEEEGVFDLVVVNDELERARGEIIAFIYRMD